MTETEAYEVARTEIEGGHPVHDIYLKAYANSNGDDKSIAAKYVLYRSQQIIAEEKSRRSRERRADIIKNSAKATDVVFKLFSLLVVGVVIVAFFLAAKWFIFHGDYERSGAELLSRVLLFLAVMGVGGSVIYNALKD